MGLGKTLRDARSGRGLTLTQAAAATQIPAYLLEDIEREDFRRIAAPIYAKGFIRMYAQYLGLDPQPLIEEYVAAHSSPIRSAQPALPGTPREPQRAAASGRDDLQPQAGPPDDGLRELSGRVRVLAANGKNAFLRQVAAIRRRSAALGDIWTPGSSTTETPSLSSFLPVALLIVLLIIILASVISARIRRVSTSSSVQQPPQQTLRPLMDPPEPYFERVPAQPSTRK